MYYNLKVGQRKLHDLKTYQYSECQLVRFCTLAVTHVYIRLIVSLTSNFLHSNSIAVVAGMFEKVLTHLVVRLCYVRIQNL